MLIVVAVLLAVVVVQIGILLAFLANRIIPFMDSVKSALGVVAGDHEDGSAGAVERMKVELTEINEQLRLLSDSKVLTALQRIEDHLFIDVCRAIQDSNSTAGLNNLASALDRIARDISRAQESIASRQNSAAIFLSLSALPLIIFIVETVCFMLLLFRLTRGPQQKSPRW